MDLAELKNRTLSFDRAEEVSPLWHGDEKQHQIKGWKGIYNIDKKKIASIVSDRYNLVQHSTVIDSVIDAVANLGLKTKARIRDGGNRLFVDLTFTDHKITPKLNEDFFAGIRIINSYDKTTGIVVAPRYLRLVCSNGMVVSKIVPGYSIKHTKKLTEDFESTVQVLLKNMINAEPKFQAIIEECIGDSIEWELMEKILLKLSGAKKHFEAIKKLMPEHPSRWDLYNAFTEYATHDRQVKPNIEQRLQVVAQTILNTPLEALVPNKGDE